MRRILFILTCLCWVNAAGAGNNRQHKPTITQTYIDGVYTGTGIYLNPDNIKEEKIKRRSTKDSIFIKRYVTSNKPPQLVSINNMQLKESNPEKLPVMYIIDGRPVMDTAQTKIETGVIESLTVYRDTGLISCNGRKVIVLIITKPDKKNKRQNNKSTTL